MARDLNADYVTDITGAKLFPVLLFKAEFDSGDLNLWTGIGEITWNGDTYSGSGNILEVSTVTETQDLKAEGVQFNLTGVSSSILNFALTEDYQNRDVSIWFAMIANGAIKAEPFLLFRGKMDVMTIDEQGDLSTIILNAESNLVDLERPNERRYTDEDQQERYPGDIGLEFVASLQEKEIVLI